MKLNPGKIQFPKKAFMLTRFKKLEEWQRTKMYPNKLTYRGPFMAKLNENMCRPQVHFEELLQSVRDVQNMQITDPAPLHLVWRSQSLSRRPWWEKVTMRKLGLHDKYDYVRTVIPNTPHYNRLLWEVKHLIRIKPLTFPDGIPTEKDIGATRVCQQTGVVRIGDQYRVSDEQLYKDQRPLVYQGEYLRFYLRKLIGIFPGMTSQS